MKELFVVRDAHTDEVVSKEGFETKAYAKKERDALNAALKENKEKTRKDTEFVERFVVSRGVDHIQGPSKSHFFTGPFRPKTRRPQKANDLN